MEAELEPYLFLQTDYNKNVFKFTNDKTTASCIEPDGYAYLATTRPIGRDHRLILKILGSKVVVERDLYFTTCDTASLLANDKHQVHWCGSDVCSGRMVTGGKIRPGSQVSIRRTTDNRIEAVVSGGSGGTSTEFWNMEVAADVPVVPVVFLFNRESFGILPDETGLQSVRCQIEAATAKKRHDVLTAVVADHEHKTQVLENMIREQKEIISSLQDQMSSLKSELSADHDHKTHVLENAVREQSELISSLQDQVELMKFAI